MIPQPRAAALGAISSSAADSQSSFARPRSENARAECAHCELPLGRRVVRATVGGSRLRFCCYGCVLALQVTRARGEDGAAAALLIRLGLAIFFAMNVMMVTLPTYAPYVYGGAAPSEGALFHALRVLALALALPVLLLLGGPILRAAWASARDGGVATDGLIVAGTAAAYGLSVWHTWRGAGPVYYDTAAMLLVLVTLGRYLEARARAEATATVRTGLAAMTEPARRVRGDAIEAVSAEQLAVGDHVRVVAGAAFPTDGIVLDGAGCANEAALTGEARPVPKHPGDPVAGGTCSIDGCFLVRVTARADDSAAARIEALLARARRERGRTQRLADRAATALVPAVTGLAIAAGAWWTWQDGVDRGVLTALAVLTVACPCALGIATPVAAWLGLAIAGRHGIVARGADALERTAALDRVMFDKTGTLTGDHPLLARIRVAPGVADPEATLLRRAAALEAGQRHPLARAFGASVADGVTPAGCVQIVPGRGVRGEVDGVRLTLGSRAFAADEVPLPGTIDATPQPGIEVLLWDARRVLATFQFIEAPRPEAGAALAALRGLGMRVDLLSGDRQADAVVPALIAPADARIGLDPEGKIAAVREARRSGVVAMVGDGLNDAPALAAADVGVAIAAATDLARLNADIVIVGADLCRIPWLIDHARRVTRIMRQNLAWACGYNLVAVAVAAAGLLNPIVASLAMLASSVAVLLNARRLAYPARCDRNATNPIDGR